MSLVRKLAIAGPWLQWAPVAAVAGLFAWVVGANVRDADERVTYMRLGLLVVAMGVAYVFDDPAKPTTDAVPSRLVRRRAVRLLLGLVPWAALVGVLLWMGSRELVVDLGFDMTETLPPVPAGRVLIEAATISAVGVALAATIARWWEERPGWMASAALLALFAGSWAIPPQWTPWGDVFGPDLVRQRWWLVALVVALAVCVAFSWDTRTR